MKRLCVATQDPQLLLLCERLEQGSAYRIFSHANALIEEQRGRPGSIVAFVDLVWPEGHNGFHTARELKCRGDGSESFLLNRHTDARLLAWCDRLQARLLDPELASFLPAFVRAAVAAGVTVPESWRAYDAKQQGHADNSSIVASAERQLESILGPMGPLLLENALAASGGDLAVALASLTQYGTTPSERRQMENLSMQLAA
jgi:hypothetical protein